MTFQKKVMKHWAPRNASAYNADLRAALSLPPKPTYNDNLYDYKLDTDGSYVQHRFLVGKGNIGKNKNPVDSADGGILY